MHRNRQRPPLDSLILLLDIKPSVVLNFFQELYRNIVVIFICCANFSTVSCTSDHHVAELHSGHISATVCVEIGLCASCPVDFSLYVVEQ